MRVPSLKNIDTSIKSINWYWGVAAAIFYGILSGSMSFINKVVLTTFDYRYPEVIMLAQVICTALILDMCRRSNLVKISAYTVERGKQFLLPSICFALHTILALNALSDLSIPMYNILRRLLPLSTLILGVFILSKSPSFQLTCSIILIVTGCIIAGLGDLSFHLGGYVSAVLSVFSQSFYLVYVQKSGVESGLSTLDVLHLNSVNCIPLLTLYTVYNDQLFNSIDRISVTAKGFFLLGGPFDTFFDALLSVPLPRMTVTKALSSLCFASLFAGELHFTPVFVLDVLTGCLLNYSLFLCATMNSALTTSLVGVIKGIITTIIGFFTFGGVVMNLFTLVGVLLNTSGGMLYFYTKYSDQVRQKLQEEYMGDHDIKVEAKLANGDLSKNTNGTQSTVSIYVKDNDGNQ